MSPIASYKGLKVPPEEDADILEVYSLTSDIFSYRRCPRLYALNVEKAFTPPSASQMYFGTIVHRVLDRSHAHYVKEGHIPSNEDLMGFFRDVEIGLLVKNISPMGFGRRGKLTEPDDEELASMPYRDLLDEIGSERAAAFARLRLFNNIYGETHYPNIIETEYRLDTHQGDYIITGIVDVVRKVDESAVELWDYKSYKTSVFERNPIDNTYKDKVANDIAMQMGLYTHIYKNRTNIDVSKTVIVCIGELDPNKSEDEQRKNMESILYSDFDTSGKHSFENAIGEFDAVVKSIRKSRKDKKWGYPEKCDKQTCDACPIRWSCKEVEPKYPRRFP